MAQRMYVAPYRITTWSAAQTICQIATAAGHPVVIYGVDFTQDGSTTSASFAVQLYRTGSAVTWTSPVTITPVLLSATGSAANSTITAFGTGTVSDGSSPVLLATYGQNVLNGLWGQQQSPVPELRLEVAASSWATIKLVGTVPSSNYNLNIWFGEEG